MTLLSDDEAQIEREEWLHLSLIGLAMAYGDDEPEYTLDMLAELNPDFQPEIQGSHESDNQ